MQSGANSRLPPWQADGQDGEELTFGSWLRREREIREIPLHEIADVTKISIRYLEALEQDRFDVLPAPVFAKGFLKEYARYVGLDPDDVINSYLTTQQADDGADEDAPSKEPSPRSGPSSAILMGGGIVVLLALVAGLIFFSERFGGEARDTPPPAIAAPVTVPAAPANAVPVAEPAVAEPAIPLVVTMDFTEDCWVEVEVDGRRRISELHVQGESVRFEAEERVVLVTLGNPAGVRIEVNGEPFDPEVRSDRVAHDIVIALEPEGEAAEGRS